MTQQNTESVRIKGIAVCNPVDVERDYLIDTVNLAICNGFNHIQIIGPTHDPIKGNVDGLTLYRKYSEFNKDKDITYVEQAGAAIREALKLAKNNGIKTYLWHHELDLPLDFKEVYPVVQNSCGDIEITHPLVRDFLEHKIKDFFYEYPDFDGIILTLHETKIPLLKLKDQKLGKTERVKYVTAILYNICKALGKELVVRPFASVEEDYVMMTKAYEEISTDMMIMDKWTQFDWSLTLPNNAFFNKIKKNPLFVEADIFGEYFGKGHLPLMLKEHIAEKFDYCKDFSPRGYVARIDRGGFVPLGNLNEVNVVIMAAHLNGLNVEEEIDKFFERLYGKAGKEVKYLVENTEDLLRKTIYINGYYYSELSFFPRLNHAKNHFYFEMMRKRYDIASNEWFIPKKWSRGKIENLLAEKRSAAAEATQLFEKLCKLEGKLNEAGFKELWIKFRNLKAVTEIWYILTKLFIDYAAYFDTRDESYALSLERDCEQLLLKEKEGIEALGCDFYCLFPKNISADTTHIEDFVRNVKESFVFEKKVSAAMEQDKNVIDYVICGGAMEGHRLQKEVNFSDTLFVDGEQCRIPGSIRGLGWCSINAHGWFSYELKVKPNTKNIIKVKLKSSGEELNVGVAVGEKKYVISEKTSDKKEYTFIYKAEENEDSVRVRFDKLSGYTPYVFSIKVTN